MRLQTLPLKCDGREPAMNRAGCGSPDFRMVLSNEVEHLFLEISLKCRLVDFGIETHGIDYGVHYPCVSIFYLNTI